MDDIKASIDSRVYKYDGINIITNMYWRTLSSQATIAKEKPKAIGRTIISKPGKETLQEVKSVSADLIGFHQSDETTPVQLGLAQSENAENWINSTVYSFPSFIFKALSNYLNETINNCIVVISITEDLYVMAATNNGRIIPRIGDLSGSKEEILQEASELLSNGGFRLFCDKNIEISGSEELPEVVFLKESLSASELKELLITSAYPSYKKILGSGAVVSILVILGFVGYSQYSAQLEEDRAAKEKQKMAEFLANQQKEVTPVQISLNKPQLSLQFCMKAFEQTTLYPGGWKFVQGECRPDRYYSTFVRGESRIHYLLEDYPDANISSDGDEAKVGVPLSFEKHSVLQEQLPKKYDVINALNAYAQSINREIVIKSAVEPKALPGREIASSNFSKIEWQITIPFYSLFKGFPTQSASLDAVLFLPNEKQGLSITVKGTSYVKN